MKSFVFERKVLLRVYFLSVTFDYRVQCPHGGVRGQNLGHLRFFILFLFFLYGIIQFEQKVNC